MFFNVICWISGGLFPNPLEHIENVLLLIMELVIFFNLKPANGINIHNEFYEAVMFG